MGGGYIAPMVMRKYCDWVGLHVGGGNTRTMDSHNKALN